MNDRARRAGVYAIVNTVTGRMYIGSSRDVDQRFATHRSAVRRGEHRNRALREDVRAYGPHVFEPRILEEVEADDVTLTKAEQRWIDATDEASLYNGWKKSGRRRVAVARQLGRSPDTETRNDLTCRRCRRVLADDETAYIWLLWPHGYWMRSDVHVACEDCATLPVNVYRDLVPRLSGFDAPGPCEGCGRTVRLYRPGRGEAAARACSKECLKVHHRAVRREAASKPQKRPCAVCEKPFTPPRSDGQYCSSACRQRAYRQRQK